MGKGLIIVGASLMIFGILIIYKVPMSWLGHLPGDVALSCKKVKIYIPFATSIFISIVLTLLFYIFGKTSH